MKMTMKKYIVSIPLTGAIHIEVEASTRSEAEKKAWDKINEADNAESVGDLEWEFTDHVTEGNVTHAMLNDIEVTEVKER